MFNWLRKNHKTIAVATTSKVMGCTIVVYKTPKGKIYARRTENSMSGSVFCPEQMELVALLTMAQNTKENDLVTLLDTFVKNHPFMTVIYNWEYIKCTSS